MIDYPVNDSSFREGKVVSAEDEKKRAVFEESRESMDAQYEALPRIFRERLDKFRRNNPDFRWKYEPYELFVCEEAVRIAEELETPDEVVAFGKMTYEEQKARVTLSDGHSGNTFGMVMRLAYLFLSDEAGVEQMHGALAPLVGSEEYGCVPTPAPTNPK